MSHKGSKSDFPIIYENITQIHKYSANNFRSKNLYLVTLMEPFRNKMTVV